MAKKIQTPEIMWALFQDYIKHVEANPFIVVDYVGKEAVPVNRYKQRPITMEGFECYVADIPGMPWDLDDYFNNNHGIYGDYSSVCSRIRRMIRDHQIGGGMAGVYNPSITQRLNGLTDKVEVKTIKEQPLFSDDPETPENDYDDLI